MVDYHWGLIGEETKFKKSSNLDKNIGGRHSV